MWKKIIVIISLIILVVCVIVVAESRGSANMYVEVYDRDGVHISNVTIEKWNITRRVFEFDTSSFEGTCDKDISEGIIFIFKNKIGEYQYSGFMKNIVQEDNYVKFKGDDLRKIYDTEIQLDYSQDTYITQDEDAFSLANILNSVSQVVIDQRAQDNNISRNLVSDTRLTQFIANYSGQKITVNAWQFIKVYLAYYSYYLTVISDDGLTTHIRYEMQDGTEEIKLDDFIFDKTTSETKTNHAVAQIKPVDNLLTTKVWMYSSEELFNATPSALTYTYEISVLNQAEADAYGPVNFEDSFQDRELDMNIKVNLWDGTPYEDNLLRTFYMQPLMNYSAIPTGGVFIEYWLGNDNAIYYTSIPDAIEIIPAITKIFESEYLSGAQYAAIWELVNSRYIEYIILTESTNIPLDIRTLELYEMITVYDSEGTSKVVPVSEITWTQDGYKVKLGFKKTLLTEIIKGGN